MFHSRFGKSSKQSEEIRQVGVSLIQTNWPAKKGQTEMKIFDFTDLEIVALEAEGVPALFDISSGCAEDRCVGLWQYIFAGEPHAPPCAERPSTKPGQGCSIFLPTRTAR